MRINQQGIISPHLFIALAILGVIIYFFISSTFPFKEKLFDLLYPKPSSLARGPQQPDPLELYTVNLQNPVEQQTPGGALQRDPNLMIINPTINKENCAWDPDDTLRRMGGGYLAAGATFVGTDCVIADMTGHLIGVEAKGDRNAKFKIELIYNDGLTTYTIASNSSYDSNTRAQRARLCTLNPQYDTDYIDKTLYPIENSNGGVGRWGTLTYRLTNLGSRRERILVNTNITLDMSNSTRVLYCGSSSFQNDVYFFDDFLTSYHWSAF